MKRKTSNKVMWALIAAVFITGSFAAGAFIPTYIKNYKETVKKETLRPDVITEKVIPDEGINLEVSFKDSVVKMVEMGALYV